MDAISVLENLGLKVKVNGSGNVVKQSLNKGEKLVRNKWIVLELK